MKGSTSFKPRLTLEVWGQTWSGVFGVKQTELQRFLIGFLILERGLTPVMWFAMLNNNVFSNMQVF